MSIEKRKEKTFYIYQRVARPRKHYWILKVKTLNTTAIGACEIWLGNKINWGKRQTVDKQPDIKFLVVTRTVGNHEVGSLYTKEEISPHATYYYHGW